MVPFAALIASDGITWHGAAVGNMAKFVALATLGEGGGEIPIWQM